MEAVLEHFRDKERRDEPYAYFQELEELHELISPDKSLRPFLTDYRTLADMVQIVRAAYERVISFEKSFLRKTEQLVKEHTATYGIQTPTKTVILTPDALAAITDQGEPDTVKVFNLLKAIEQLTGQEGGREPYRSLAPATDNLVQARPFPDKTIENAGDSESDGPFVVSLSPVERKNPLSIADSGSRKERAKGLEPSTSSLGS